MKVLVIKGSGGGGLGDRIRAVLVGCIYASITERKIFIDWRDGVYGPDGINVFEEIFCIKSLATLESPDASAGEVYPPAWSERLGLSMDAVWKQDGHTKWNRAEAIQQYSFNLGKIDYNENVLVMWEFDQLAKLRPYLSLPQKELSDEELLRWAYFEFLEPLEPLKSLVEEEISKRMGAVVGVHVRATKESIEQKGLIPLKRYIQILDHLLRKFPINNVFVSTDNLEMTERLLDRYPTAWNREKWFSKPGEPLHLNDSCPDKLQAAKDAVTEMLLLAECDYLVSVQNSSFSMIARIMSKANPDRQVVLFPKQKLGTRIIARIKRLLSLRINL